MMEVNLTNENIPVHLKRCLRCGRKLKSAEATERGYGKTCWEKRILDCQRKLF